MHFQLFALLAVLSLAALVPATPSRPEYSVSLAFQVQRRDRTDKRLFCLASCRFLRGNLSLGNIMIIKLVVLSLRYVLAGLYTSDLDTDLRLCSRLLGIQSLGSTTITTITTSIMSTTNTKDALTMGYLLCLISFRRVL